AAARPPWRASEGSSPRAAPMQDAARNPSACALLRMRASHGGRPRALGPSELLLLGRVRERRGRDLAVGDGLRHLVEVARADEALVLDRGVAVRLAERELPVLESVVRCHPLVAVAARQLAHP